MWKTSRFRALNKGVVPPCLQPPKNRIKVKGIPLVYNPLLKVGDVFLILCLLCACVISWATIREDRHKAKYCIISVNGKDAYKLLLSNSQKLKVNGPLGESMVEISYRGVRILHSPCPLKMCMHQGVIEKSGQMIVCVPNRIMIRITGTKEVDAITW